MLRWAGTDRPDISYGQHQKTNRADPLPPIIHNMRVERLATEWPPQVVRLSKRKTRARSRSTDQLSSANDIRQSKAKAGCQSLVGAS
jgi:hypothetical protein